MRRLLEKVPHRTGLLVFLNERFAAAATIWGTTEAQSFPNMKFTKYCWQGTAASASEVPPGLVDTPASESAMMAAKLSHAAEDLPSSFATISRNRFCSIARPSPSLLSCSIASIARPSPLYARTKAASSCLSKEPSGPNELNASTHLDSTTPLSTFTITALRAFAFDLAAGLLLRLAALAFDPDLAFACDFAFGGDVMPFVFLGV